DRGLGCEQLDDLLVLGAERLPILLLRQVEVPEHGAAKADRDAEERAHRRMARREADGARVLREVLEPQRLVLADQHAEDASPSRRVADRRARRLVDADGDELL